MKTMATLITAVLVLASSAATAEICVPVINHGTSHNRLDIVFVPTSSYDEAGSGTLFASDVWAFTNALQSNQQLAQRWEDINLWRIDKIDPSDGCHIDPDGFGVCDAALIDSLASECPVGPFGIGEDQVVVMFDDSLVQTSSSFDGHVWTSSFNSGGFAHELGHSFAKLGDEFSGALDLSEPEFVNCASDAPGYTPIEKWGDLMGIDGVSAFQGCGSVSTWYRPTSTSCVMFAAGNSSFCPVCERELLARLDAITSRGCAAGANTLCLNNDRFRVEVVWATSQGTSGQGQKVRLTDDSGYFWFFDPDNIELVVKVLDACQLPSEFGGNHFWVFAAGLTNVETEITVTDTQENVVRTYRNPLNTPFQPIQDTNAFATCP